MAVDRSGSMEGNKLSQAKRGAVDFAKEARKKGYLTGLIAFDSYAAHLCSPQSNVAVLQKALKSIVANGSTNMTAAIELATEKLRGEKGKRVIILVTDGAPDNADTAMVAAHEAKKQGIDIITVGTEDADSVFLKKLASRNNLATVATSNQLKEGIVATVEMLPRRE